MQPEEALRLVRSEATLACVNLPHGARFGLDRHSWVVGDKFRGMKMIPPGAHLVSVTPPATPTHEAGQGATQQARAQQPQPPTFFWVLLSAEQVLVREWDSATDSLVEVREVGQEERIRAAVQRLELDAGLAPYPRDDCARWAALTSFITRKTIARLDAPFVPSTQTWRRGAKSSPRAPTEALQPCTYSPVPKVQARQARSPAELTAMHMDKTPLLRELLAKSMGNRHTELLGELQHAFMSFIAAESYDGFLQWKELLVLLCSCEAAVEELPDLYTSLCHVLLAQLEEAPADFFHDPLSRRNFLQSSLRDLFEIIAASSVPASLHDAVKSLKSLLRSRFSIDYDNVEFDPDDEYAPVVVSMTVDKLGDLSLEG